jgi:SOS response regulatory protein OraA/RecX
MNVITNYRFINEDVHIEIASETLIISYALFLKYQLKIGLEMTPSLKEQIANDVLFERLYLEAKTYLKRMRTRDEVKTFLLKISSKETIIKQVIDHLKDKKYLDDMSYIKRYIQTHEHYGPNKCVFELMKKGIRKDDIQRVLQSIDFDSKLQHILQVCSKKNQKLSHQKKLQKCYLHASHLGYENSQIQASLTWIEKAPLDEETSLQTFFIKSSRKLKGTPYEKCQSWIKKAMQHGYHYEDAKIYCKVIENETSL